MFKKIITYFLLSLFIGLSYAQNQRFKTLSIKEGLSQSTVNCIIQDQKGFIWIGTQDGLNRYDGHEFVHFKTSSDSNSIPDNFVQSLFEDSEGNLWIGTYGGGVAIYNPTEDKFQRLNSTNSNLTDDIIMCFEEYQGHIYIGTKRGGLNKYNIKNDNILSIELSDTSNQIQIRDLSVFNNKLFCISSLGGIHEFQNEVAHNQLDTFQFQCISKIDNSLWFAGLNGKICKLNDDKSVEIISKEALIGKEVWGITSSKKNCLWIATFGGGLIELDLITNKTNVFKSSKQDINSISHDVVLSIFKDIKGGIWIGTLGGGINYFEPENQKFKHYNELNGLSNNVVMSFLEKKNSLYIGTFGGGLNKFNLNTSEFENFPNLGAKIIRCIYEDENETFWIGTYGNGLIKYDPKTKKSIKILPEIANDVWCIEQGSNNEIWIGTWGGGLININIDNGKYEQYLKSKDNSISENTVLSIATDSKGNLWLGTYGSGLNYYNINNNQFTNFSFDGEKKGTNNKKIRSLLMVEDNLLIGTDGGGLNYYNNNTKEFSFHTTNDGLPNNVIYGLGKDQLNNLWITTNYGLSRFSIEDHSFLNFDYNDGLQNNEFNQGALIVGRKNIYAGGIEGFNIFNPENIKEEISTSKTVISSMKVSGEEYFKPITFLDKLTLHYTENFLSFQFSNLDYSGESEYRCQLLGLDKEWINLGKRNFINYTNLPPGKYALQYQGKRTGKWNTKFETLLINIPPPFWKTTWFSICASLLTIFLLYFFYALKQRSLRLKNIELENQVITRTQEIELKNKILEGKNKDITDSLNYAKNIQQSILPKDSLLKKYLPHHFIFYKPKDIVSGDFYWAYANGDEIIFAVVDCTGHGVPGAFMSIIGGNGLHKAVVEEKLTQPNFILDSLNSYIKKTVQQEDGFIRDGMDIAICNLNIKTNKLQYSGAFNSLILIQNKELNEIKADRHIIGSTNKKYLNHALKIQKNDAFYIFTDGFADQFGGPNDKKFNFPKFRELLFDVHDEDIKNQHAIIRKSFEKWIRGNEQIDDVCVMGIKV